MKKILSAFLVFSFLCGTITSHAFFWGKGKNQLVSEKFAPKIIEENLLPSFWLDSVWNDPFFQMHSNFMRRWYNPFWDVSVPQLSLSKNYPLDLKETDIGLVATIDIPTFNSQDISVEIKNDRWLIVQGKKEETEKYYYRERNQSGSFLRTILLPYPVKKDEVKAVFEDDILIITMPKKEGNESSNDTIEIEVK